MDIEYYDFTEQLSSAEWIQSLPKGLISEKIDIRLNVVSIIKLADGYQIYIGPKDLESGGEGIMVTLDEKYQIKDYEIERIAPVPE